MLGAGGAAHRMLKVQWREILTMDRSPGHIKVGMDTELKGAGMKVQGSSCPSWNLRGDRALSWVRRAFPAGEQPPPGCRGVRSRGQGCAGEKVGLDFGRTWQSGAGWTWSQGEAEASNVGGVIRAAQQRGNGNLYRTPQGCEVARLMPRKEGGQEAGAADWGLEAGDRRQRWLVEMRVHVSGDVSPKKARPGRRKGLRNTHSIGAIYPQELWIERTEGEARFVPEVVGGDEQEEQHQSLGSHWGSGPGLQVQASWLGQAASWPGGVGSWTGSRARTWESGHTHVHTDGGGEGEMMDT